MAYVMNGTQSEQFKTFKELCCKAYNILRRNSHVFINLLAMMLSTGIPELRSERDLNYLREGFLNLVLSIMFLIVCLSIFARFDRRRSRKEVQSVD